jgi:hypothetical protein
VTDEELIGAGYVLTVPADAAPDLSTVPTMILTISDCITRYLPRPEFWDWYATHEDAALARSERAPEAHVTPIALRPADAHALMNETGGDNQPYFAGLTKSIPFTGDMLGYKVVGAEGTLDFHSWHCHGYADEVSDALGIRVNDLGLLSTYSNAASVLSWMLDCPSHEAPAPVPWVVVALGAPADT